MSSPDRLVYMANQIGKFFHSQGNGKAVPGIAEHIKKFWDNGGAGLDPDVKDAVMTLKKAGAQ